MNVLDEKLWIGKMGILMLTNGIRLLLLVPAYIQAQAPEPRHNNPDLLRPANITPCSNPLWSYSNITGSCYAFQEGSGLIWQAGVTYCANNRSRLLYIEDDSEQTFLDQQLLRYNFADIWIGGKYDAVSQTFKWTDNTPMTYGSRWAEGEPMNGVDKCVFIRRTVNPSDPSSLNYMWQWFTGLCSDTKAVYCKQSAKRCPAIPMADFVVTNFSKPNIEQTIGYSCQPGYQLPDYADRYAKWQSKVANNQTNDTEPYYKLNPTMSIYCGYSGAWMNTTIAVAPCEPLSCTDVPVVKNALANSTSRIYPTYVNYTCKHGYYFKDVNSRSKISYCGYDTKWRDVPRQCDPVPCVPFVRPINATSNDEDQTFFGDIIGYRCISGTMFPDGAVWNFVACRQNYVNDLIGQWNETDFPPCGVLQCSPPVVLANMIQIGNGTAHRTMINYTCFVGYEFPDSSTTIVIECSDDALWKPKLSSCAKTPQPIPVTGKYYQPPTVDAPGATSIGSTALIIVIILIVVIVLLDLTTISKDIKMMRINLRHMRRRFSKKQHIP